MDLTNTNAAKITLSVKSSGINGPVDAETRTMKANTRKVKDAREQDNISGEEAICGRLLGRQRKLPK